MDADTKQALHNLVMYGGRWSIAASAKDHKDEIQNLLEAISVPFALTFHPRPGWQFVVDPPEARDDSPVVDRIGWDS